MMPYAAIVPLTPETVAPLAGDAVEVVVTRLDLDNDAFHILAGSLCEDELARARRFHLERDRRRFIVARGRLRQMLAQRLGIQPQAVELSYGAHGKPFLAGGSATMDWRFNVSHSRDIAVFAFCRGREIGIDVEAIHRVYCADTIAQQFFSRNEVQAYLALDPRDKEAGFFNCWTRKEAFIKAIGDGLHYPLDSFDVSVSPHEPAAILRLDDAQATDGGWCLRSFSPMPGYVAALVVERCRTAANDETYLKKPACTLWIP
ncbi:MAG: 4'-phosphopantetheinyl transferase superfamily protein [Betaproteobacteria bacterium]